MTQDSALIAKLKTQQAEIQKKIRAAKQTEKKKAAAFQDKKSLILGRIVLDEIAQNTELNAIITNILKTRLVKDKDRKLFNLEPLPGETQNDSVIDEQKKDE